MHDCHAYAGTSAHAGYDPDIVDGIESYGPDDNMDGQHEVPPGTPRHSTRAHLPSFGEDERTLEAEDGPEVMEQDEIYEEEGEYVQIVRNPHLVFLHGMLCPFVNVLIVHVWHVCRSEMNQVSMLEFQRMTQRVTLVATISCKIPCMRRIPCSKIT